MKKTTNLMLIVMIATLLCILLASCQDTTDQSIVTVHEHAYGEWLTETEPTCTEIGKKYKSCSVCGDKQYENIAALEHEMIPHDSKAQTCTENGWEAYESCSRCDYSTYKEIAASHKFENGVCSVCNTDTVTDWYDETKSEFQISDAPSLRGLAKLVNEGISFEGKKIVLSNDIDLQQIEWIPIGTEEHPFTGTFDGKGAKIIDLSLTTKYEYMGLFGVNRGSIKNLVIDHSVIRVVRIDGVNAIGTAVGLNIGGTIENVSITESTIAATVKSDITIGGLVGSAIENSVIYRCSIEDGSFAITENDVTNVTTPINAKLGGLIGESQYSSVSLSFTSTNVKVWATNATTGGLIAYNVHGSISNCYSLSYVETAINGNMITGGLIGYNSFSTLENSYASATIRSSNPYRVNFIPTRYCGSLVGSNEHSNIDSCFTQGFLTAVEEITQYGVIVGNEFNSTITNCYHSVNTNFSGTKELTGYGEKTTALELSNNIMGWSDDVWEFYNSDSHPASYPTLKK